jgi:hypothetical protein
LFGKPLQLALNCASSAEDTSVDLAEAFVGGIEDEAARNANRNSNGAPVEFD